MEFMKTENGMTTLLVAATLAMAATVAFAFYNAFQNITYTGF